MDYDDDVSSHSPLLQVVAQDIPGLLRAISLALAERGCNIDVALVCMNLPYTMTPEAAAEAVRAFHPAIVYPYHYSGSDTNAFAKALAGTGIEVRLRDWYAK